MRLYIRGVHAGKQRAAGIDDQAKMRTFPMFTGSEKMKFEAIRIALKPARSERLDPRDDLGR
jgi:hypothetical protein